jgi:hypothetical protein
MIDQTPLIELLAATDALFQPIRDWRNNRYAAAIVEARRRFTREGLAYRSGGDPGERKAKERAADAWERAGMVTFHRSRGKRSHWRLTDTADWMMRRLATFGDFPEMLTAMLAIDRHERMPHEARMNWVPEWWLTGANYDEADAQLRWTTVQEILAPALCRGLVEAWSDCHGRTAYQLTDRGREFLAGPAVPSIDWPEYDTKANDLYLAAFDRATADLKRLTSQPNHVAVRLSAGLWPCDTAAAKIPNILVKPTKCRSLASMRRAIKGARP